MYLYVPIGGRSIVINNYTISSTGMQFSEKIPELDAELGNLLTLTSLVVPVELVEELVVEEPTVE